MRWLETFPSTNARIAMTLALAAFFVVYVLVSASFGKAPDEDVLYIVGGFIAVLGGFDVTQFWAKRRTEIVVPPETMASNAEAVTVAAPTDAVATVKASGRRKVRAPADPRKPVAELISPLPPAEAAGVVDAPVANLPDPLARNTLDG